MAIICRSTFEDRKATKTSTSWSVNFTLRDCDGDIRSVNMWWDNQPINAFLALTDIGLRVSREQ